jgi:hypothetical protein
MQSDRQCATIVAGALALFSMPSLAHAYCHATSDPMSGSCPADCPTTGTPLAWGTPEIEYALNRAAFVGMDEAELRAAIARSFAHWSEVDCNGMPIGFAISELPQDTDLTVGPAASEPNLNVISQLDANQWSALGLDAHTFAKTQLWFDTKTGEIVGADIAFNGAIGAFTVCSESGCPSGAIDLENVATHEIGHFLGLAHSADPSATMWCDAVKGDLQKRSLSDDDRAGLCAIYGSRAVFVDRSPLSDVPKREASSGGCAVNRGNPTDLGLLIALATLLRRKKTRPR